VGELLKRKKMKNLKEFNVSLYARKTVCFFGIAKDT
tara:strand:+ start:228 stop:335 length:108 start_codon:yes stop_codon:yes gene_type:complete